MHNAKIIRIDENFFKGRTKERQLFDRRISNNATTINKATIIRIDDDLYGGEVKDGKPHGKGILKYFYNGNADGRYVGEFKDGKRSGVGTYILFDGTTYVGEWFCDKFHGKGKFTYQGDVQEGHWFMGSFERCYGEELEPCNYIEIKK